MFGSTVVELPRLFCFSMTNCSFCFSDGDNRVLLKQVFIGIIFMSLDGVPLIAVLNTLSGFHFSLTRFSITVIINIIKEAAQNPVLLPFGSIPNVWELFFYSYRAKMEYRITDKFISFGFFIDLNQDGYAE